VEVFTVDLERIFCDPRLKSVVDIARAAINIDERRLKLQGLHPRESDRFLEDFHEQVFV
jgi:hypothetical protein